MAASTAGEAVARPRASTAAARTAGDSDASASPSQTRSATRLPAGFRVWLLACRRSAAHCSPFPKAAVWAQVLVSAAAAAGLQQ